MSQRTVGASQAKESPTDHCDDPNAERVPIEQLRPGASPRATGVNAAHVHVLAELDGRWPAILVMRTNLTIVDGLHRFHAARTLGHTHMTVLYFDGTADEAYVEALRCNANHGLPLTLRERESAAIRVLELHPSWSDRRIAAVAGLAPSTVARIRADRPGARGSQLDDRRIGADGRVRPLNRQLTRQRIAEALESDPAASLRQIAQLVGASPETVRSVREHLRRSDDVGLAPDPPLLPERAHIELLPSLPSTPCVRWKDDCALTATDELKSFSEWFEGTWPGEKSHEFVTLIPLSRVYEVAEEARRRAEFWSTFANAMEGRGRTTRTRPNFGSERAPRSFAEAERARTRSA